MKKLILTVEVKQTADGSPDTSYLGEYSNTRVSQFSIDRRHSLKCPVNTGETGGLFYQSGSGRIELTMTMVQAESVSHSGDCGPDVETLASVPAIAEQLTKIDPAVLAGELREYGAWDAEELADHSQNLTRLVWLAGCDIREQDGCDCGERGDMGRNEYRYFNPSHNYVNDAGDIVPTGVKGTEYTPADVRKFVLQDYARMESLNAGEWCYVGLEARASVVLSGDISQTIRSGGLWGIESDAGREHLASIEREELASLRGQLTRVGFSRRAIATAFKGCGRVE